MDMLQAQQYICFSFKTCRIDLVSQLVTNHIGDKVLVSQLISQSETETMINREEKLRVNVAPTTRNMFYVKNI